MNSNHEIQRIRVNRTTWKASMAKEIIHLEDDLDQLYYTAGLKPHRIVKEDQEEKDAPIIDSAKGITQAEIRDFELIIDEQVDEICQAVRNICGLISSVTEFELPVPVLVLLRLANRISVLRCPDFKKKVPGTLAKKHIYTKRSSNLVRISLTLYKWVSIIVSTNIVPFQPYINQNLFTLLVWTRDSNLLEHDAEQYYTIRMEIFSIISKTLEAVSLNLNLDSKQLNSLVEVELIGELDQVIADCTKSNKPATPHKSPTIVSNSLVTSNNASIEKRIDNQYACVLLECLDRLFIVYANLLSAKLELKLKTFVIQTCIRIYRDFEHSYLGLNVRRQLLRLLETISNQPYATSTTELAWHIFELCDRMETDPEICYIARRSIKVGLAHRATIVSHFDVHDCYARCDILHNNHDIEAGGGKLTEVGDAESVNENDQLAEVGDAKSVDTNDQLAEVGDAKSVDASDKLAEVGEAKLVDESDQLAEVGNAKSVDASDQLAVVSDAQLVYVSDKSDDDDEQVNSYLDKFVD